MSAQLWDGSAWDDGGRDAARPPVSSEDELAQRWSALLGPDGFAVRSLWLTWYDGGDRQLPVVMPVDDVPAEPDARLVRNLVGIAGEVLDEHAPGGWVSMALARPGAAAAVAADRAWGRALHRAARDAGLPLRPLHVATHRRVRVLRPDDVL